jgi:long-chain acyl-CoA synthetase
MFNSLTEFFKDRAERNEISVVYSDGEHTITHRFSELYRTSLKIADFLQSLNVEKGEPVALMMKNRPEWLAIYMGILNAGGCALPMDIHLSPFEVKNLVNDSKARIFFTERELLKKIRSPELESMVRKFVIRDSSMNYLLKYLPLNWVLERSADNFTPVVSSPDDPASLIYTSGTTAKPKGALLKHKNFLSQLQPSQMIGIGKSDRVLMVLPLNHAYSFSTCFLGSLIGEADIYILDSLKRTDLLSFIKEHRLTTLVLVPAILLQFYKSFMEQIDFAPNSAQLLFHTLKSIDRISGNGSHLLSFKRRLFKKIHEAFGGGVRYIISGAAGLDEEIAKTFNTLGLPVFEGYGLTETSPVVACNSPRRNCLGTVGQPLPGVSLKIHSPSEDGIGEIAVKGAPVFEGYLDPRYNEGCFTEDGYFLTGDLGFVDEKGFLTISGRCKDVIVLPSGKNVFPDEIEDYHLQSECIKEIGVFGVPKEIGKKAEEIYAVIVPNVEFFRSHNISDVEAFVKNTIVEMSEKLPSWCRINRFEIRYDPLPRSSTRKIKKFLLREEVIERMKRQEKKDIEVVDDALLQSPVGRILDACVTKVKGGKINYTLQSHLFLDLGFDSLSISELIVSIEEILRKTIPKSIAYETRSIGDGITLLGEFCAQNEINVKGLADALYQVSETDKKTSWVEILDTKVSPEVAHEIRRRLHKSKRKSDLLREAAIEGLFFFSRLAFWLKVSGLKNLPERPPFILAADHASYSDPFFVLWALPRRLRKHFFVIGKKEHLRRIDRTFFTWIARMIPVDREGNFLPALQMGKKVLDEGHIFFIHPEGTPSMDGMLNRFKNGVGILAETTGVPVIPIHLEGTFNVLNRDQRVPRPAKVKIYFGKPIVPSQIACVEGEERHTAITKEIERRIVELGAKPRISMTDEIQQRRERAYSKEKVHAYG